MKLSLNVSPQLGAQSHECMFERDATSEPMLEPNSAVTQLPAVYRFGFSNYTPFQVTAYSG